MERSEAIAYIKDVCEKAGINPDTIRIGYGKSKEKKINRYVYNAGPLDSLRDKKYVMKCFYADSIIIIWRNGKLRRTIFSVKAEDVIRCLDQNIEELYKNIAYSGWGEEVVLVFSMEQLKEKIKLLNSIVIHDTDGLYPHI